MQPITIPCVKYRRIKQQQYTSYQNVKYYSAIQMSDKNNNKQIVEMYFVQLKQCQQLYQKVKPQLQKIANNIYNEKQIKQKLMKFSELTAVSRYPSSRIRKQFSFKALNLYKSQLKQIYSKIASYILKNSIPPKTIELIPFNKKFEQPIYKKHIIYILCLMSMMLIPKQNYEKDLYLSYQFHHIKNFQFIFNQMKFKTRSIIQYLKIQLKKPKFDQLQAVIITRNVLQDRYKTIDKFQEFAQKNLSNKKSKKYIIQSDTKNIQQFYQYLKVDFANQYVGGGSLTYGSAQQQIMFALHPELYVSMLLCEKMEKYEALKFQGFKKYFNIQKHGHQPVLTGEDPYKYKYDKIKIGGIEYHVARQRIVAIDAFNFNRTSIKPQSKQCKLKQLMKAYTGFSSCQETDCVVTGNWGCGIFGGKITDKFIIQYLAACLAGKNIIFCPYGERKIYQQNQAKFEKSSAFRNVEELFQLFIYKPSQIGIKRKSNSINDCPIC